jgi:hypothetical protein
MAAPVPVVRSPSRASQSLVDKVQEIGARSPADYAALVVLADAVLDRLDAADRRPPS